jgi:hypothetical protein
MPHPPWVLVRNVNRSLPASNSASAPRGSIEATTTRLLTIFSVVTCAACANNSSVFSFCPICQSKHTLPGASAHTCGAPGANAPSRSVIDGSMSYSTMIASAASRPASTVSATMNATGTPACRTSPSANAGRGGEICGEPSRFFTFARHGRSPIASARRSALV